MKDKCGHVHIHCAHHKLVLFLENMANNSKQITKDQFSRDDYKF
jgi:hypothetical protein